MRLHTSFGRRLCRLSWYSVAVATLALLCSVRPGDVITIRAQAIDLNNPRQPMANATAECRLVVKCRGCNINPVYLAHGWKRVYKTKDGRILVYYDHTSDGMRVRAWVIREGEMVLADGIQTSDGRVWVAGELLERVDSPKLLGP